MSYLPKTAILTIQQAASQLGVSSKTLRRWETAGYLAPQRTIGNQRRYTLDQLENLKNTKTKYQHLPIPSAAPLAPPLEQALPSPAPVSRFFLFSYLSLLALLTIFSFATTPELPRFFANLWPSPAPGTTGTFGLPPILAAQTTAQDFVLKVNVPAIIAQALTAPNIVYSVTAGTGVSVSDGQKPTIANTGVLSLGGSTGALTLAAGTGISVSGTTITNSDTGSGQKIFKTFSVSGQSDIVADSNTDTFTFAAGTGITLATDATNDKLTITGSGSDLNVSGWYDDGTVVRLVTSSDNVGIGTTNPGSKLQVAGSITPATTSSYDLGSSSLVWNTLYVNTIYGASSGTSGHWQRNSQALSPTNITDDILLGATATSSALVKLTGTSGNNSWVNTGNFGIGTTSPDSKLHVAGTLKATGTSTLAGIDNSSGGITNSGPITGATGFTSSGTITLGSLSTGILHANFSGVLSSSAVDLASGDVTGTLPTTKGGTGLTSYTKGDLPYASATNTLANLGIGASGQVLTVSAGIPAWGTVGGVGGLCTDCVLTDPGSTQTITPSASTATGLIVAQASSGSVDIFSVTNYGSSTKYLYINSSGNAVLGGTLTVSPASTDPIAISPVAAGANAYTGTLTSSDLTAARTWTLPDAAGNFCLDTGNCAGVGSNLGGSGTANYVAKWQGQYSLNNSSLYDTGNVGIGLTNPGSKLAVAGNLSIGSSYAAVAGPSNGAIIQGNVGIGTTNPTSTLYVTGTQTVSNTVSFLSTLGVTGATTLSSTVDITGLTTIGGALQVNGTANSWIAGNVGIGTTAPGTKLHVYDSTSGSGIKLEAPGNIGSEIVWKSGGVDNISAIRGRWNTGASGDDRYSLGLYAKGVEQVTIGGAGNVGIGTTSPSQKLHVEGQCVTGDSLLVTEEGQPLRIDQVKGGEKIFSLDQETGRLVPAKINGLLDMGVKPVFKLTTEDGKSIRTTGNHPYLTPEGWKKVIYLKQGQKIAVANLIFSPVQINEEHKNNQNSQSNVGSTHDLLPFRQENETNNSNTDQTNENINLVKSFTDINHFSPFLTNLTETTNNVKEKNPPIAASNNVGRTTEDKTLGRKYPPKVDKTAAFERSSQYRESNLYWEETNLSLINHNNNQSFEEKSSDVKWVKIASIEYVGHEQVYDIEVEGTHNFVANGIIAHNTYISSNVGIGTTSPTSLLQVDSTNVATFGKALAIFNHDESQDLLTASASGTTKFTVDNSGNLKSAAGIDWRPLSDSTTALNIANAAGTDFVTFDTTNSRVGIGTTGPGAKLHVQAAGTAAGLEEIGWFVKSDTDNSGLTVRAGTSVTEIAAATLGVADGSLGQALAFGYQNTSAARTEAMRIDSTGNVGIGTTAPALKFEVDYAGASRNTDIARFMHTNLSEGVGIGYNQIAKIGTSNDTPLYIDAKGTGNLLLQTTSTGNVGIGTTGPSTLLHTYKASGNNYLTIETATADQAAINLKTGQTNANWIAYIPSASTDLRLYRGSDLVTFQSSGNVGIGTTGPGNLLHLSGSVSSVDLSKLQASYTGTSLTSGPAGWVRLLNTDTTVNNYTAIKFVTYDANSADTLGAMIAGVYPSHTAGAVSGELAFITNNAGTLGERVRIDKSGNVGIGTTAPGAKLHVNAGTSDALRLEIDNENPFGLRIQNRTVATDWSKSFNIYQDNSGNARISNYGLGTLVTINNAGNVGIGTTSPAALLELSSAATTGTIGKITSTALTSGKTLDIAATGNGFTTGSLISAGLTQTAATGTSVSGDIAAISFSPTYSTAITTPAITGQVLDISRSVTTNTDFASTLTLSGALAVFSDTATQTQGTLTSTADVVQILQNYSSNTGAALNITSAGGAGSFALRVNDNGTLTDTSAFVVDNSGNVGIGTTGPGQKLHVYSTSSVAGRVESTNTAGYATLDSYNSESGALINVGTFGTTAAGTTAGVTNANLAKIEFTGASNAVISAFSNIPLIFGTNDLERVRITNTGNVGIGTTGPGALFEVNSSNTATFGKALAIFNHDESQDLLTASASGTTKFAVSNTGALYVGDNTTLTTSTALCWETKTLNGATVYQVGDCTGTPADLAEWYPTKDTSEVSADFTSEVEGAPQPGEIVAIGDPLQYGSAKAFLVEKTAKPYEQKMLGVVSSKSWQVMGEDVLEWTDSAVAVGLVGRVPVKISPHSPAIEPGDFLTSSEDPGKAMKADQEGYVIGKALEKWTPGVGQETILVYLNQSVNLGKILTAEAPPATESADLSLASRLDLLEQNLLSSLATESANLAAVKDDLVVEGNLTVLGKTLLADLGITGKLTVGLLTINGLADSSTSEECIRTPSEVSCGSGADISTLSGPLKLQELALGNIEMMAGKIVIDTAGNLKVNGTITAKKYNLDLSESSEATVSGVLGSAAGKAEIPAGQTEIEIKTTALTENSLIFATPESTPAGVASQKTGENSFKILIDNVLTENLKISWWIIN